MSVECQVNIKSQSELDIGGRETCLVPKPFSPSYIFSLKKSMNLNGQGLDRDPSLTILPKLFPEESF